YCAILSGTPLENRLEELYSVMQFVDQYALGPFYEFKARFIDTSETGKVVGYHGLGEVRAMLAKCLLRRRKADVALQLPERSDKVLYVPMTKEQSEIHDECRNIVAQLAAKWQRHRFLSEKDRKRLLLLLSRMRMVCDSTFVVDQKTRFDTKIAEALQLVSALTESGDEKVVIFSQWERMTRIMAEELDRAGIGYEYLHGGISASRRRHLVENFSADPDKRVFLSTDAGSTGLNLQAASLIINLDLPWNPAVLEQRIARIYRIGQRRNIQVINMVAAGSIEERMTSALNFKSELFAGVFDGGEEQITLDDNRLTRIIEAVAEVVPEQTASQGSLVAETEETAETASAQETPAPEVL
ncbi:MAG: DEAD/DEAH box helicase, partial [Muribaculaceae bacterium]|nr:DEAD/DEAH box helicase [Muribaculaceae bacterium]